MRLLLFGFLVVASSFAQQVTVSSAAAPGVGIAPGSVVAVSLAGATVMVPDPSTVSIQLQSQGSTQAITVPVLSSRPLQYWAMVPADFPLGPATVTLAVSGIGYPGVHVNVVPVAIGLFAVAGQGLGPALAQNTAASATPSTNQLTNPVLPGQYVTLWATGLGTAATPDVTVELAGELIHPSFAGHSPAIPGVDQVNFPVPADAFTGCYVPLTLRAGDTVSNQVTLAIAGTPGACAHPLGLTPEQMQTLDQGGAIPFGSVTTIGFITSPSFDPSIPGYTRYESASAMFLQRGAFDIFLTAQPQQPDARYFSCSFQSSGAVAVLRGGDFGGPGGAFTFTGPAGRQLALNSQVAGLYSASLDPPAAVASPTQLPPPFFVPGTWRVSAAGDSSIGPFQQSFTLPPQVRWTNRDSLGNVSRTADAAIAWDPSGYSSSDVMNAVLAGAGPRALSCAAPAQAGTLVLPKALLQQLSASSAATLTLHLLPRPAQRQSFTVPLASGGTSPAVIDYSFSDARPVAVP
jgi:uncharacterized protein (TIGR03437 family)